MASPSPNSIAVVGAGPAGSLAAASLAARGRRIFLFDEKPAWEKPCGGGITHKALLEWPFLREANVERNWISACELISPAGRSVTLPLEHAIAVFSRRVLNNLCLDQAVRAGAEAIPERIVGIQRRGRGWILQARQAKWQADYLVIAAGARNSFRKQLSRAFAPEDLMVTAGYYIPARSQRMQIQFLANLEGYIWVFPRADHLSAGICGKMGARSATELRGILERWLVDRGWQYEGCEFYSHVLPSLRAETFAKAEVSGDGWAMIGDAAGFVDPITGEGLYYAMRSSQLLTRAVLADRPDSYPELLRRDFLPELELAAEMADRFYSGRWMGESVLERTIQFTANSPRFRRMMSDIFAGTQGYRDLRRRLCLTLPAMLAESLASTLRLPGTARRGGMKSRAA